MALSELEKHFARKVVGSDTSLFILVKRDKKQIATYGPLDHQQALERMKACDNTNDYVLVALGQAYAFRKASDKIVVRPIEYSGMRVLPRE